MEGQIEYLLDSDILIAWLRGSSEADLKIKKILLAGVPKISVLSIYELIEGAYRSRNPEEVSKKIMASTYPFEELKVDREICIEAAKTAAVLKKNGSFVGEGDILIGAIALKNNLTIVTRNTKHFSKIPNIKIEEW